MKLITSGKAFWHMVLCSVLLHGLALPAQAAFSDVKSGMPFFEAITFLENKKIVQGYGDGSFGYSQKVSRGEFLKIILEFEGEITAEALEEFRDVPCFTDVEGGWSMPYICYARSRELVNGYTDGSFHPEQSVTITEALRIVAEVFEILYPRTEPWYRGIMEASEARHLIPPTITHLSQELTRAEVADLAMRIFFPSPTPVQYTIQVPFTSQAPDQYWGPPFDEACEEAALIMAEYFLRGQELPVARAKSEIEEVTAWVAREGYQVDMSVEAVKDAAERYYGRNATVYSGEIITAQFIKELIWDGMPVIVPVAGQHLGNPHFKAPGPPFHMIVVVGYTPTHFITHDPGTRYGGFYEYPHDVLMNALHDWTGSRNTILQGEKAVVVISEKI